MTRDELETQIITDANRLMIEMAVYRLERAPAPVNIRDYFAYAVRYEALIRRGDDARPRCSGTDGRLMGLRLELIAQALDDMARATTSNTPEEPFHVGD
jgi:hypothetical protein